MGYINYWPQTEEIFIDIWLDEDENDSSFDTTIQEWDPVRIAELLKGHLNEIGAGVREHLEKLDFIKQIPADDDNDLLEALETISR